MSESNNPALKGFYRAVSIHPVTGEPQDCRARIRADRLLWGHLDDGGIYLDYTEMEFPDGLAYPASDLRHGFIKEETGELIISQE